MKYEMILNEQSYRGVVNFIEQKNDYAVFTVGKVMFVLCHGSVSGLLELGDELIYPEVLLKGLIARGIKDEGIIAVRTISCYGAYQKSVTIDDINICPAYAYKGMLDISVHVDLDYNYKLIIEEYESKMKMVY